MMKLYSMLLKNQVKTEERKENKKKELYLVRITLNAMVK